LISSKNSAIFYARLKNLTHDFRGWMLPMNKYLLSLIACALVLPACSFFGSKETKSEEVTPGAKEQVMEKTIFTFFGAPGSGKGTLAEKCVSELGFKVLSTGNLCRAAATKDDEKSKMITSLINEGKLVPDEMITEMVADWLEKEAADAKAIILDGYPRTQKQAELLVDLLKDKFADYKFRVVSLSIPDAEIIERLTSRRVCSNKDCQSTTSLKLLKDPTKLVCEKCGAELIQRKDDSEEVITQRLNIYAQHSGSVLNYYKEKGIKIEELNVSKISVDEVFENFKKMLQ